MIAFGVKRATIEYRSVPDFTAPVGRGRLLALATLRQAQCLSHCHSAVQRESRHADGATLCCEVTAHEVLQGLGGDFAGLARRAEQRVAKTAAESALVKEIQCSDLDIKDIVVINRLTNNGRKICF